MKAHSMWLTQKSWGLKASQDYLDSWALRINNTPKKHWSISTIRLLTQAKLRLTLPRNRVMRQFQGHGVSTQKAQVPTWSPTRMMSARFLRKSSIRKLSWKTKRSRRKRTSSDSSWAWWVTIKRKREVNHGMSPSKTSCFRVKYKMVRLEHMQLSMIKLSKKQRIKKLVRSSKPTMIKRMKKTPKSKTLK